MLYIDVDLSSFKSLGQDDLRSVWKLQQELIRC